MYDRVSINKVFSSKPIYSTCFSGLSVLSALKISTGVNTIEESAIDVSFRSTNSIDLKLSTLLKALESYFSFYF